MTVTDAEEVRSEENTEAVAELTDNNDDKEEIFTELSARQLSDNGMFIVYYIFHVHSYMMSNMHIILYNGCCITDFQRICFACKQTYWGLI